MSGQRFDAGDYFNPNLRRDPETKLFPSIDFFDATGTLIASASVQAGTGRNCFPQENLPRLGDYETAELLISTRSAWFELRTMDELLTAVHGIGNIFAPKADLGGRAVWPKIDMQRLGRVLNVFGTFISQRSLSRPAPMADILARLDLSPSANPESFVGLVKAALDDARGDGRKTLRDLQVMIAKDCLDAPLLSQKDLGAAILREAAVAYVNTNTPAVTPAP